MLNKRILVLMFVVAFLLAGCIPGPGLTPPIIEDQAPVITSVHIPTSATVGVAYTYDVEATDPDGDTLTYFLTTKPSNMTIDSTTGLIKWTPYSNQVGVNPVTVEVSDGTLSDTQSFTIIVSGAEEEEEPSPAPSPTPTKYYTITATAGDNGTIDPLGKARVKKGSNQTFTITPDAGYSIADILVDGSSKEARSDYTFTNVTADHTIEATFAVEAVNQAPVIYSIPNLMAIVGVAFTYEVEAFDPDDDVLIYSLTDRPKGMEIESDTGKITWTPTSVYIGWYNEVIVSVSDGELSDTKYFTVTVDPVTLIGIEVDPEAMDLFIGRSKTIESVTAHYNNESTTIIGLGDCTYRSDSAVVEVDFNGLITAISLGKATITVTYETTDWRIFRDTVKVTVKELTVVQDSLQNDENRILGRPYINWTIDGPCIEFVFVNPTIWNWAFDYRVDGEEGEETGYSGIVISGGELYGEEIGPSYNIVDMPAGEPGLTKTVTVCVEEEVWVGMRLGAENDYYLDWIIFEAH